MVEWILVFMLAGSAGGRAVTTVGAFITKAECQQAGDQLRQMGSTSWSTYACVKHSKTE